MSFEEWYVFERWTVLHAAREIDNKGPWEPGGFGVSECSRSGLLAVPGPFSRMGLRRCKRCCKVKGIPEGYGTPYNDESLSTDDGTGV